MNTFRIMVEFKKNQSYVPFQLTGLIGDKQSLSTVRIRDLNGNSKDLNAYVLLACLGLSQKCGPITAWRLAIENKLIKTDPTTAQINQPWLFAIGDIAVESRFSISSQNSTIKGLPQND